MGSKPRVLIFIVAYNAETTIEWVLGRVPASLTDDYEVEALVIDDSSSDATFEVSETVRHSGRLPFPLHVLFNPVNQGYGGNQKIGYQYAIRNGFDFVALVHGDGQYAPEELPRLIVPLAKGEADAVFGSRMLEPGRARSGGMPLYKYLGNRVLSWFENRMLGTDFSEFHSGYRIYRVAALAQVPFWRNTEDFHFDTEIIIQFVRAGLAIKELPIPTYYGDEICRVNGIGYAANVAAAVTKARLQDINLLYDRKFDCRPVTSASTHYEAKFGWDSPHSRAVAMAAPGARVLDLGCAGGYVGQALRREKNARVTGIDAYPLAPGVALDKFHRHDLDVLPLPVDLAEFDDVLMLDVIEHLADPEAFVESLRESARYNPNLRLVVSTGNVAFVITRMLMFLGMFNYGKKGILDITHKRLFTAKSLRDLFEQSGFAVEALHGLPVPWPLAFGENLFSRFLLAINGAFCRVWRGLFAYQILMVLRPKPHLDQLLLSAQDVAAERSQSRGLTSVK